MEAIAADIDRDNYRVFLTDLDIDRTVRIYKALAKLSEDSVAALNSGMFKEFSVFSDRMRPLLSYIADNSVKLSNFTEENLCFLFEILVHESQVHRHNHKLLHNLV